MSFVTASYDNTGSYISGTIDAYNSGKTYSVFYAPPTFKYSSSVQLLERRKEIIFGPNQHTNKPSKL